MQRIGILCGAGIVSGKEVMAMELAEGLRASGCAVDVVTSRWGNGDFGKRMTTSGFCVHRMWLGFISATISIECLHMTAHQALHWPELLVSYGRFLRSDKPQKVIHTNWHHLLLLWPFLQPKRDLFWLHEIVPNKPQYRRVFHFLAQRLQCFVTVSQAVARSLTDLGIPSNKIRVIHNGLLDPVLADWVQNKQSPGARIGIIGQVGAWKGHEDLLDAFALLMKSHPGVELHVFGRGSADYERQLKDRAASLGVSGRISWHGFVPDRTAIFESLDICAVPSRFEEPFGLVAAEAGFFGLPVVASRCGGLPEIVVDGVTGFLVTAENPSQLAKRLNELLQSEELRKNMGAAARQRAVAHFSRERFVKDFVRLLDDGATVA